MNNHPNKEFVDILMGKIKKHAELWALARTDFNWAEFNWSRESGERHLNMSEQCRDEAREVETDIENSLYVALDKAFDNGHDQGGIKYSTR